MTDSTGTFGADNPRVRQLCANVLRLLRGEEFSGARFEERKKIVICMTPRSGSSYLSSVLSENGLGKVQEHFRVVKGALEALCEKRKLETVEQWVAERIANLSTGGIYGFKADWPQFVPIYYLGGYDYFFRDAAFVYLTRNDVMAQAISRYISTETGYFHSVQADLAHTVEKDIELDFDKLQGHLDRIVDMQGDWERFFAHEGISPLRISYEEIDADAGAVVRKIGSYAGLQLPEDLKLETDYRKVSTERNDRIRTMAIAEAKVRRTGANRPGATT
ncbi:Stf0 family sulfotransferase [Parasphingopyxis marina]|uniref:Sulfotransferase n=1 Tax=Parasphingopyxis marina TaxID=2761622 RepID=A0A842HWZ4_9SPHN|nr:Stf0 family sulfotransferase [Parasphingopyxis marina]MBC2776034.1 sulfotransferase [Parasphingopyxis marina]